ncbi:hypothetical protein T492DRAFT_944674 [Pavlovales sp. CCMP2436]|nr:hypothetical protein T492DRAFT_944674 [Pavlovales sp. CCMP2436]
MGGDGHTAGVSLGLLAALSVSSDGLLVKLASRDGAYLSTIMIVKAGTGVGFLLIFFFLFALVTVCKEGSMRSLARYAIPSRVGVVHVMFGGGASGIMSLGFTLAFYYATSANVLAFTALTPVWAALLTKPVLNMRLPWRTIWCNAGALAGTAVVVVGVALESVGDAPRSARDTTLGTLFAIMVSVTAAAYLTTIRSAAVHAPGTDMRLASLFGMIIATCISIALVPLLQPLDQPLLPANSRAIAWLTISGFFVVALALLLINAAVQLTSSPAEVSLILQIEGLLGPISVYAILGEVPSPFALGGGCVVLLMVAIHETLALFADRADRRAASTSPASDEHPQIPIKMIY